MSGKQVRVSSMPAYPNLLRVALTVDQVWMVRKDLIDSFLVKHATGRDIAYFWHAPYGVTQ